MNCFAGCHRSRREASCKPRKSAIFNPPFHEKSIESLPATPHSNSSPRTTLHHQSLYTSQNSIRRADQPPKACKPRLRWEYSEILANKRCTSPIATSIYLKPPANKCLQLGRRQRQFDSGAWGLTRTGPHVCQCGRNEQRFHPNGR